MGVMQGKELSMTAVFAHRGCTEGFVENTLEAFAEAKRLGADGVELDVRLTADGALAVHHDPLIDGLGPVAGLTVPELPAHVPLLADALAVCEGMVVNVEIKNDPAQPGHDPGETVAAAHRGGHCRGGLDRPGDRLVVPGQHVAGRPGGRRPAGPRRPVAVPDRSRPGWPWRSRRGGAPSIPS
jgi:glycerophosphoryl diester phosphodiesterase